MDHPLLAVFLIFIVPGHRSGALLDIGDASSPDDPRDANDPRDADEDGEDGKGGKGGKGGETRGLEEDDHANRAGARPLAVDTAPRQKPVAHRTSTPLTLGALKAHSSRLSVQRQQ